MTLSDPADLILCCIFALGSSAALAMLLIYCIICNFPEVKKKIEEWSQMYGDGLSPVNARMFLQPRITFLHICN